MGHTPGSQAPTSDGGDFSLYAKVAGVNEELGLVFGWAIVCSENGKPYFDKGEYIVRATGERVGPSRAHEPGVVRRRDHIPEDAMLKAAEDFSVHSRVANEMHLPETRGQVVFLMPLTADIKKAFGITVEQDRTGLMLAMKPDPAMLAKFKSGELTGFSIGGKRIVDEPAGAAA